VAAVDGVTKLGSATEAVILSTALSLRIAAMRRERDRALVRVVEARLEGLDTLVAGVGHEIGNPLNAAHAAAAEIERRTDGDVKSAAGIVIRGLNRIGAIVTALRSTTRGREVRDVSVAAAIDDVLLLVGQHDRVIERSGDLVVRMGEGELEQVLHNLVKNAIDATPSGGKIGIRCSGNEVVVQDSGAGVPEAIRDRIFDPFFSTKPPQKGTGLGLWVSAEICRHRGHELVLDSTAKGGRFVVRFKT
jgi:two-component system NtrC family sensor kinase